MAVKYAVASGNWSSGATWNGGTVPTSADDVYSNGFTVTINGTFTVLSIRNTLNAVPVVVAGGQFIYANGGNLTCTASPGIYVGVASVSTLEMNLASPNTAIFNGSVLTMNNLGTTTVIKLSGTGTLSLNGNYSLDGSQSNRYLIQATAAGVLNIVGDVTAANTGTNTGHCLYITAAATINITGNVTGGPAPNVNNAVINSNSTATINITGNVTTPASTVLYLSAGSNVNIIGNVSAGSTQPAVYQLTTASTITVTGIITAGSGAPAIYAAFNLVTGYGSGTYVKISGNVINTLNMMAVVAPRVTIDSATSSWLFQISTGGNRTLYAAGVALGNPATTDVRNGTTYGASLELTGTLIVPSPSNVLQGVATDATTGTLLMTPADFWNYLISSGFTANSIGDRLQNASTVATTGGQIASYNV